MATSDGSSRQDRIGQFEAVTGATSSVAEHFLDACDWNLEMAIGMHMDSGGNLPAAGSSSDRRSRGTGRGGVQNARNAQPATGATADEVDVRAPIPQKHETLIEEQFSFATEERKEDKGVRGGRRRTARSVFDGFRDFQAEARQQELAASGDEPGTSVAAKKKTLEDLFRPPLDLLQRGSFMSARNKGSTSNKWLLINVQNVQEFACQVLNRDVWSNSAVKDLIKTHFVFWQVYSDSEEGKKYMQFYKVKRWPYIAVLDPRTGENMVQWEKVDALTFCDLVTEFISDHPSPDGSSPTKDSPPRKKRKEDSIVDASEDSQLEAAIQASLQQAKTETHTVPSSDQEESDTQDTDDELETFSDSDEEGSSVKQPSPTKKVSFESSSTSDCTLAAEVNGKADKTMCSLSQQSSTSSSSSHLTSSQGSASQDPTLSQVATTSSGKDDAEVEAEKAETSSSSQEITPDTNQSWKEYLGDNNDPVANLMVRFPDGKREALKIPCSSKLKALVLFVVEQGFSNERYELVTNYPRKKLSYLDFEDTLKDIGLFPQETVFVQER